MSSAYIDAAECVFGIDCFYKDRKPERNTRAGKTADLTRSAT